MRKWVWVLKCLSRSRGLSSQAERKSGKMNKKEGGNGSKKLLLHLPFKSPTGSWRTDLPSHSSG